MIVQKDVIGILHVFIIANDEISSVTMKYIIYIFLLSLLVSCRQEVIDNKAEYTLFLDSISQSFPNLSRLTYVPLETTEASLIRSIDKILYSDHKIYVFDKDAKRIICFNEQGKYLSSINRVGQGPGEYLFPSDIDIDENGNLYVYDFQSGNIVKYESGNANDFDILKIGERSLDFAVMDSTVFLSRMVNDGTLSVNLASWDKLSRKIEILKENKIKGGWTPSYYSLHYFFRSGSDIFYYERFHSAIYLIDGGGVKEYIVFHSQNNPSIDVINSFGGKDEEWVKSDIIKDVSACYSTEEYIFVTIQPLHYCLIQRKTGKVYNVNSLSKYGIPGFGAFAIKDNDFISYCTPSAQNMGKIYSANPNMNQKEKELLEKVQEEDNPILIFYNFE